MKKSKKPILLFSILLLVTVFLLVNNASAQPPGYEKGYVDGKTITFNAILVPNHVPLHVQADLYQVVYPIDWAQRGLAAPQCNPCDHGGDGIDFTDFHDHVLDSMPGDPGHGAFNPLWHVFVVMPAYSFLTGGDPANDDAIAAAYASRLPMKSETAVDDLLDSTLPEGTPVAVEIDTNFYFLCAIVNSHAAH
jgi:hypothetical protein